MKILIALGAGVIGFFFGAMFISAIDEIKFNELREKLNQSIPRATLAFNLQSSLLPDQMENAEAWNSALRYVGAIMLRRPDWRSYYD